MEHISKEKIGNTLQEIRLSEDNITKDYQQLFLEISNYEDDNVKDRAFYIFSEKKELSKFIGVLLHIQSKMK
mgnify:CR=1 FL=1